MQTVRKALSDSIVSIVESVKVIESDPSRPALTEIGRLFFALSFSTMSRLLNLIFVCAIFGIVPAYNYTMPSEMNECFRFSE